MQIYTTEYNGKCISHKQYCNSTSTVQYSESADLGKTMTDHQTAEKSDPPCSALPRKFKQPTHVSSSCAKLCGRVLPVRRVRDACQSAVTVIMSSDAAAKSCTDTLTMSYIIQTKEIL